jgi:RNA polymerase sigma factor for flagellar operon FliA
METSSPRFRARLDPATVERLWRAWKTDGDISARNRLVVGFTFLVRVIAARQARQIPAHCEIDDLISVGHVAFDRCDRRLGSA